MRADGANGIPFSKPSVAILCCRLSCLLIFLLAFKHPAGIKKIILLIPVFFARKLYVSAKSFRIYKGTHFLLIPVFFARKLYVSAKSFRIYKGTHFAMMC
jgi:hypothetical protein